MIDADTELKILENSIRDIISFVLNKKFGTNWIDQLKISDERVKKWKEKQLIEEARLKGNILENRLIYYSDFYDLKSIIDKHWNDGLIEVFHDKKTVTLFLEEAEKLRDPNAHRRELFDYQKHLIKGVSGELRTRIMKYRGKKENPEDFFPMIESVTDNLGNRISSTGNPQLISSNQAVKSGDIIEIIAHSTDPLGDSIEFSIERNGKHNWTKENRAKIIFDNDDIGLTCDIYIYVRSLRDFHAYHDHDDRIIIRYIVLPQ